MNKFAVRVCVEPHSFCNCAIGVVHSNTREWLVAAFTLNNVYSIRRWMSMQLLSKMAIITKNRTVKTRVVGQKHMRVTR